MSSIFIYFSSANGQTRKSRNVPVKIVALKMIRSMLPLFIRMKYTQQVKVSKYTC